jgi:hypothetical protein
MTVALKLAVVVVFVLGIVVMAIVLDGPRSRGGERVRPPREVRPRLAPPRVPRPDTRAKGTPGMPADLRNRWRRTDDESSGAA